MGRTGWVVLFSVGLAGAAVGQEPVRVYTNADLKPLPSVERSSQEVADTGPGWELVIDFLAEQHARIDADRSYELDGAALDEAARRSSLDARPRYALPLAYGYYPWAHPQRRACASLPAPTLGSRPPLVVPLHARRPIR